MQDEGVVKTIKAEKGFGFISMQGGPDVFFHVRDCGLPFDEQLVGRRVVFTVVQSEKGPRAKAVRATE